jgi:ubiquinone/menaquinone biosynthesis C-methylase UbiE
MNDQSDKRIANAYEHYSHKYSSVIEPTIRPMADEIINLARIQGPERIIDLATGTGLIARKITHANIFIIGVDISLGVLRTAQSLSGGKIPFIVGDAHQLPFIGNYFDLVTCGLSLSHFSDISIALREARRVLRLGGRFIASAWSSEKEDPSYSAVFKVLEKYLEGEEEQFEVSLDEAMWADVRRVRQVLRQAGFGDIKVSTLPLKGIYRNPRDAVNWAFAWPLVQDRIGRLDPINLERLKAEAVSSVFEVNNLRWWRKINCYYAIRASR